MQIAISRQASEAVNPTSSRFAIEGLDRSYSIAESVDIHASRPKCSFAPSLIYHNNAMTINKYVEAEQRTTLRLAHDLADAPVSDRYYSVKLLDEAERT